MTTILDIFDKNYDGEGIKRNFFSVEEKKENTIRTTVFFNKHDNESDNNYKAIPKYREIVDEIIK